MNQQDIQDIHLIAHNLATDPRMRPLHPVVENGKVVRIENDLGEVVWEYLRERESR